MAINFNTRPIYKDIETVTIDGQAMVKIPAFYVKYGTVPAGRTYAGKKMHLVSERALTGYHLHPAFIHDNKEMDCFYIGAYEGYNAGNNVCGSATGLG